MSAFVGPIHHIMYDRILLQDQMTETLLLLAEEAGWSAALRAEADGAYPAAAQVALTEVVDPANIHGWLTEAVEVSERRLALVAASLLADEPERLALAQERLQDLGRSTELNLSDDLAVAHRAFGQKLLDGMPCDFPFAMDEPSDSAITWTLKSCPHAAFWVDGDAGLYYELREAFVRGLLADTAYRYGQTADTFSFGREE